MTFSMGPRVAVAAIVVAVAAGLGAGCGGSDRDAATTSAADAASAHAADQQLAAAAEAKRLRQELAKAKRAGAAQDAQGRRGGSEDEGDGAAPSSSGRLLDGDAPASFAALERELGGASGLAVAPAGAGQTPVRIGTLKAGPAWSTMKVPVALAAQAAGTADASEVTRAITASDNDAAQGLWDSLGSPGKAGALVQRQLAAAGDSSTQVQTQVTRPGFSSFGQTVWPLMDQTRFVGGLACEPSAESVLTLMKQVEGDQRWGLGTLPGEPAFKGGWGPDTEGAYFVRQMGIVPIDGKPVAVSIATTASDGAFATGTDHLSRIAAWAAEHVRTAGLPSSPAC